MIRTRIDPAAAMAAKPGNAAQKRRWIALLRCQAASISPMFALMLIPISGAIAYAVELGGFQYVQRSAQNAADAAAIAAASNNSETGTTYLMEARGAARPYGYVDGSGGVTVDADKLDDCPPGTPAGSTCYEAVITTTFPLTFSRIVGFLGTGGTGSQLISARAVAISEGGGGGGPTNEICVWTFTNLQTSGTPDANLAGCAVLSEGNMTCTGGGLHADFSVAGGTVSGSCAEDDENNLSFQTELPTDPYAALATPENIPNVCGATTPPQLVRIAGRWRVPVASRPTNEIAAGTPSWSGSQQTFCGDVQLIGNVALTGTSTLIIENGRLDLNGFTLQTESGAAATIVFSGDPTSTAYSHYPTSLNGGGIIDIQAPSETSASAWKEIAIYQDPAMTTSTVDFTYSGNSPTWNITGVVYLPNATTTFSGVVNKASNGAACIILIVDQATINGTGKIIGDVSGCSEAGITPPTVVVGSGVGTTRPKLVL